MMTREKGVLKLSKRHSFQKFHANLPHSHHDNLREFMVVSNYGIFISICFLHRYISIHMFLTDEHKGGELLFPLADNETFNWQVNKNGKQAVTQLFQNRKINPGKENLTFCKRFSCIMFLGEF